MMALKRNTSCYVLLFCISTDIVVLIDFLSTGQPQLNFHLFSGTRLDIQIFTVRSGHGPTKNWSHDLFLFLFLFCSVYSIFIWCTRSVTRKVGIFAWIFLLLGVSGVEGICGDTGDTVLVFASPCILFLGEWAGVVLGLSLSLFFCARMLARTGLV